MQSPEAGEIVTVQRLSVVPGQEDAFVSRFRELDVLRLAAAAAGGELQWAMLVQDGSTFLVVTVWTSPAGIEGWLASPSREVVFEALGSYYEEAPSVNSYTLREVYDTPALSGKETV